MQLCHPLFSASPPQPTLCEHVFCWRVAKEFANNKLAACLQEDNLTDCLGLANLPRRWESLRVWDVANLWGTVCMEVEKSYTPEPSTCQEEAQVFECGSPCPKPLIYHEWVARSPDISHGFRSTSDLDTFHWRWWGNGGTPGQSKWVWKQQKDTTRDSLCVSWPCAPNAQNRAFRLHAGTANICWLWSKPKVEFLQLQDYAFFPWLTIDLDNLNPQKSQFGICTSESSSLFGVYI